MREYVCMCVSIGDWVVLEEEIASYPELKGRGPGLRLGLVERKAGVCVFTT